VDFSPKQYLLIYALIVTPIVLSFLFARRRQSPTSLNLTSGASGRPMSSQGGESRQPLGLVAPTAGAQPKSPSAPDLNEEKSLNVIFNWNGHSWDAYEVLGLPAGSSIDAVQSTYQQLLTRSDSEAVPFFRAAYEAIVRSQS